VRVPIPLPFTKASACGNDFLLIDAAHRPAEAGELVRRLCDRHNGVGADGVEWLYPGSSGADVEAQLINADGSPAEVSGNGTRCVAAYWRSRKLPTQKVINVLTGAGVKECTFITGPDELSKFEMRIGVPEVREELTLRLPNADLRGLKIWMGNPQFVVFVDDFDFPWQARGAAIQAQPEFPDGTNVDFVKVIDQDTIESRFFERGAGETMSSGTGSCASALAAIVKRGARQPVTVKAPGGAQVVRMVDKEIFLQGPARIICDGVFFV
jgi:diaminopimelate epimerase